MFESCVFETTLAGHHGRYLIEIVKALNNAGHKVTVCLPTVDQEEFQQIGLAHGCKNFSIQSFEPVHQTSRRPFAVFVNSWRIWRAFKMAGQEWRAKLPPSAKATAVFPYADSFVYATLLLGLPVKLPRVSFLRMRPWIRNGSDRKFGQGKLLQALEWILTVRTGAALQYLLDRPAVELLNHPRVRFLADPADDPLNLPEVERTHLRARYGIESDGLVLLVCGAISIRKGLRALLSTFCTPNDFPTWKLLLVGQIEDMAQEMLERPEIRRQIEAGAIIVRNKFVTDQELQEIICASDAIWLGYEGHVHMSNIMVLAGRNGKPTISCADGLIGWYATRYQTGLVSKVDSPSIAEALNALGDHELRGLLGSNGKQVFCDHTWFAFGNSFASQFSLGSNPD